MNRRYINLFTSEQENRERTAGQYDKDFKIVVGLDQNKDGVLSHDEQFDMDFNIRTIGKEEYEYCRNKYQEWKLDLVALGLRDAADFLDIFLDSDLVPSYQTKLPDTVPFSGNYDQRNALGCNALSYTLGDISHYCWNENSGISQRISQDIDFWDEIIKQSIIDADIEDWYADPENNSITQKVFSVNTSDVLIEFKTSTNFKNSLGKAIGNMTVNIYAIRSASIPKIVGLTFWGNITDLYDFRTHVSDDDNGYASRIQTCYDDVNRTAGEIYEVTVEIEKVFVYPTPVNCDDLTTLWQDYLLYID